MTDRTKSESKAREANREFLARRSKRLRENRAALTALYSLGLTDKTLKAFYLGLAEQYIDAKKIVHEDALIAPRINESGKPTSQSIYFNIPGVTVNPYTETFWSRGEPKTYYSEAYKNQKSVVICHELLDLWSLHQLVNPGKQKQEILFIASSNAEHFPQEWYANDFWERFENIYLAYPNDAQGDKTALKAAQSTGNSTKRLRLTSSLGSTWQEFCRKSENAVADFKQLLAEGNSIGAKFSSESNEIAPGRFGYQPVDIAGTYHNGFLYYPIKTLSNVLEKYRDEHNNPVSEISTKIEVVLIRSDRSIQTVIDVPAPHGTPPDERVMKLSDGTLIESRPKSSIHSTWSWNSIQKFCSGKAKTRSLGKILNDVKDFLKKSVWLPFEADYDLLTLLVPVTFSQAIFQSVPLILVTGAPGSGRSALGKAMIKMCSNASTVGQISAAAIARLLDETKGFVVFDDLESIGRRKGREAPQFTELVQALKLSYNQETSWKTWTDVSRGMSVKRLNFYGVKMINNTTGVDHILGSRVLKIYTQKIPPHMQTVLDITDSWDPVKLGNLRDELHTWTFENVSLIDKTYQRLFPAATDRASEISAPLKVFAELSEIPEMQRGLERALEFQSTVLDASVNPVELMKEAVKRLALSGYSEISPTHVVLEMRSLLSTKPVLPLNGASKWENPAWVGQQLRLHNVIQINSPPTRQFLFGKYLRIYPLKEEYLKHAATSNSTDAGKLQRQPLDFCAGCETCSYRNYGCPMMKSRTASEKQRVE